MKLPIGPDRLRSQFPALTDDDLDAYVTVTRRILGTDRPAERSRLTRELVQRGRDAASRTAAGEALDDEDALLARYVRAIEKMQGRTS